MRGRSAVRLITLPSQCSLIRAAGFDVCRTAERHGRRRLRCASAGHFLLPPPGGRESADRREDGCWTVLLRERPEGRRRGRRMRAASTSTCGFMDGGGMDVSEFQAFSTLVVAPLLNDMNFQAK
ncbi:hypothetical protein BJ912DRAFT_999654 [Pholiota molesta]|nr:hypothetical protein BJ912DRAFT_999654 [Pholiota molesta]